MKRKSKKYPPKNKRPTFARAFRLSVRDRRKQRRKLAAKWLRERPFSKYRYEVEQGLNGTVVYLARPARLNKGFDFEVRVSGFRSPLRRHKRKSERPSHADVIHDLRRKLQEKPKLKADLFRAVSDVYEGLKPDVVLKRYSRLSRLSKGLPIDLTLKVLKWLFIEQDLTYWLGTGRDMLMNAIERKAFGIKAELYGH